MADDAEIRRANFKKLWPAGFSPAQAARDLWGTPQMWSDLYHGRKSFGEKLARRIEDHLDLSRLSLDDPAGPRPSLLPADVMRALESASPETQARAAAMLRLLLEVEPNEVERSKRRAAGA